MPRLGDPQKIAKLLTLPKRDLEKSIAAKRAERVPADRTNAPTDDGAGAKLTTTQVNRFAGTYAAIEELGQRVLVLAFAVLIALAVRGADTGGLALSLSRNARKSSSDSSVER